MELLLVVASLLATGACGSAAPDQQPDPTPAPPTSAPTSGPVLPAETAEVEAATELPSSALVTLQIVPEQSEVRFLIDEVLAGSSKTVVGTTTAVSGQVSGDFADPQGVLVGPIQVDLSTLRTDNNFRNRALHEAILQTGSEANRFATFQATAVEGLPDQVTFGTSYEVALTGDLTIHGVTRSVTFAAVVTPISGTRLEGTASVTLPTADFDVHVLRLPPQVASVGDLVTLQIDFVAEAS
jgi:polyisoprenoid-binding protein YceI